MKTVTVTLAMALLNGGMSFEATGNSLILIIRMVYCIDAHALAITDFDLWGAMDKKWVRTRDRFIKSHFPTDDPMYAIIEPPSKDYNKKGKVAFYNKDCIIYLAERAEDKDARE